MMSMPIHASIVVAYSLRYINVEDGYVGGMAVRGLHGCCNHMASSRPLQCAHSMMIDMVM